MPTPLGVVFVVVGQNLGRIGGVAAVLTGPALGTFGAQALVAKGGPRTKVLATLAPLDFETTVLFVCSSHHLPDFDITSRADTFVLTRNEVQMHVVELLCLVGTARDGSVDPYFAAHDAVSLAHGLNGGGIVPAVALAAPRNVGGVVDQLAKLGEFSLGRFFVFLATVLEYKVVESETAVGALEWFCLKENHNTTIQTYPHGIGVGFTTGIHRFLLSTQERRFACCC